MSEAPPATTGLAPVAGLDPGILRPVRSRLVSAAPVKTLVKTLVKTRVKTEDALLAILAVQSGATLAEAAAHLGKSVSAIERAARRLREDGRLRYLGPQKGGRWEVME